MAITLHYDVRKKARQGNISERGAILEAKSNPLGWGVNGANCDSLGAMMARRYLRDVCDELSKKLRERCHVPIGDLRGVFGAFEVFSHRGYWRVQVTVPDGYADNRGIRTTQSQEKHTDG